MIVAAARWATDGSSALAKQPAPVPRQRPEPGGIVERLQVPKIGKSDRHRERQHVRNGECPERHDRGWRVCHQHDSEGAGHANKLNDRRSGGSPGHTGDVEHPSHVVLERRQGCCSDPCEHQSHDHIGVRHRSREKGRDEHRRRPDHRRSQPHLQCPGGVSHPVAHGEGHGVDFGGNEDQIPRQDDAEAERREEDGVDTEVIRGEEYDGAEARSEGCEGREKSSISHSCG